MLEYFWKTKLKDWSMLKVACLRCLISQVISCHVDPFPLSKAINGWSFKQEGTISLLYIHLWTNLDLVKRSMKFDNEMYP